MVNKKIQITFAAFVVFILAMTKPSAGTTYYVNPGGSIQAAIDAAMDDDEIEVAPGTYSGAINFLTKAVRVYSTGGPTVTTINGTGHYHVVQCVLGEGPDTILEGFKITGGNANGTGANSQGGGMRIANSNPMILNCNFASNAAVNGGGIYMISASPTVTGCTFTGNSATSTGGGMYNSSGSNPIVTDCTFTSNSASSSGSGVYNYYTNIALTGCTFSGNTTVGDGAGVYNVGGSSSITDCIFTNNNANYGGGIYNTFGAAPTVVNCVFKNNTTTASMGWAGGGGILNQAGSVPMVINCLFRGNSGYGISNLGYGGTPSHATLVNCILWADTPGEVYNNAGDAAITYSDIQGGYSGTGNINSDPLFLNAAGGDFRFISSGSPCVDTGNNSFVTEPNDLAGNPRIVDGDWNSTATVDMGPYELQSRQIHNITQNRWYELIQTAINDSVNADQIEVGPGTYNEAVNFSGKAIELYSTDGPEVTTIDATGLNASVVTCKSGESHNTVLEGFALTSGSGTVVSSYRFGGGMYNSGSSPTVTDCIFTANTVSGDGGGMFNTNSSPTVSSCRFEGNSAAYAGGGMDNRTGSCPTVSDCDFSQNTAGTNGGGMENNNNAHAVVMNCTFNHNETTNDGGGMYNYNSNAAVIHCTFSSNIAHSNGGGMKSAGLTPAITDCAFIDNDADGNGGGMHNDSSNPAITNCHFSINDSTYGGGLHNHNSKPTLTNCIFHMNSAETFGGGIANYNSSHCFINNCTIQGNAASGGAGIRNYSSSPIVTNCIVWGNTPDGVSTEVSGPVFTYNDIQGGYDGPGNIDIDPNFIDAANPDFDLIDLRLTPVSPCIDAGKTTAVTQGVLVDMDGTPRALDDPSTPDTGVGFLEVTVDMGAYEFDPCIIEGDINCDGKVNLIDLHKLAANWLVSMTP